MASEEVPPLFAGLKFWISRNVPQRQYIVELAREHGAEIVLLEAHADHMLADRTRKPHPPGAISFEIIQSSIRDGHLRNPNDFRLSVPSRVDRPVGSVTVASRGGRTKFTEEEDQFLHDFVTPYREQGGRWKGNEIYRQLERLRPQHTFQSWRDRYIKHVCLQQRTLTADLPVPAGSAPNDPDSVRSPKRRRIEQSADPIVVAESSNAPSARPRPDLPPNETAVTTRTQAQTSSSPRQSPDAERALRTFYKEKLSKYKFSYSEIKSMYDAVPDILMCTDESSRKGFTDVAKGTDHTVEAWESLYKDFVLPEFRRRNDLLDNSKLEDYVDGLIAVKQEREKTNAQIPSDAPATAVSVTGDKTTWLQERASPSALSNNLRADQRRQPAGHSQSQSQSETTATASASQLSQSLPVTGQSSELGAMPSYEMMSKAAESVSSHTKGTASEDGLRTRDLDSHQANKELSAPDAPLIASSSNNAQSHGIPESGQRPVRRPTPTPPSQPRTDTDGSPATQHSSTVPLRSSAQDPSQAEGEHYLFIDLTQDNPQLDAGSDHAFSDTGSEYHPFDTAPERSQFWAESPVEGQSSSKLPVDGSDGSDESDETDHDVAPRPLLTSHRSPRPGQRRGTDAALATEVEDTREGAVKTAPEHDGAVASRLDTQALFQNSWGGAENGFDLPDPAEGWEELGIDADEVEATALVEMQGLLSDKVLQSTERSDAEVDTTPRRTARVGVEKGEVSKQAMSDEDVALTISSGRTEEESERSEEEEGTAERLKSSTNRRSGARSDRSASHSSGGTDGEDATDSSTSSKESTTPTFDEILRRTRQRNGHLSEAVVQRLATTAVQACTLDLRLAKSVVRKMTKKLQEQQPRGSFKEKMLDRMSVDEATELIPENVRGCWTAADDEDLLGSSKPHGRGRRPIEGIQKVERKHGKTETAERVSFLEVKYGGGAGSK